MGTRQRFAIPDGWIARGFRFEVQPTTSEQPERITQSFGGRRFAYNWALGQVKANLDAHVTDPAVPLLAWNFYELRRAWNQAKDQVAPWWRCSSKEAYACGIADLVTALGAWSDTKAGRRAGRPVGFPRFKARRRDRGRVRFTTGAMRLEPDRRHLVLPVIGKLRSKENTRRLERLIAKGRARVLSMTLVEQGGRLFVSVQAIIAHQPRTPADPAARCGHRPWHRARVGGHRPPRRHDPADRPSRPMGGHATPAPPGRPAAVAPHRRLPSPPPHESQVCGPRPASGQPTHQPTPHPHHHPDAPLRHHRRGGPRRAGDGPRDGPAGVPPHRLPGRDRQGPPHPDLQERPAGRTAGGG
jgi:hypothetical protein